MIYLFCPICKTEKEVIVTTRENKTNSDYFWIGVLGKTHLEDKPPALDLEITVRCKSCHKELRYKRFELPIEEMESRFL